MGHYDPQSSTFGPIKNSFGGGGGGSGGGGRHFGKKEKANARMCSVLLA